MNRELYLQLRQAGYTKEEAADAARNGSLPDDPTAPYWDALIQQESGGNQGAVSPAGAVGIAQVMPGTGPEAAQLAGLPWNEEAWRSDPVYNAAIGRAYLRKQMQDFGDPRLGLAAYNAGPGRVRQHLQTGTPLPEETQNYVPAIAGQEQQMNPKQRFAELRQRGMSKEQAAAAVSQEFGLQPRQAAPAPMPQMQQVPNQPPPAPMPEAQPVPRGTPERTIMQAPGVGGVAAALRGEAQPAQPDVGDVALDMQEQSAPIFRNPARDADWSRYLPQNLAVEATGGAIRGLGNMVRGARQLWNQAGDQPEDDAKLRELITQQDRANQISKAEGERPEATFAGAAGELFPQVAAFGVGQGIMSNVPKLGGMLGSGTVTGALQGALAPVGSQDSRFDNAAMGAAFGAAGDAVGGAIGGGSKLIERYKNSLSADEALDDFTGRVLGGGQSEDALTTYKGVGEKAKKQQEALEKWFTSRYSAAEEGGPPIHLLPSAGAEFKMSKEVADVLDPKTAALLRRIDTASVKTSPILDVNEKPFTGPQETTFSDVRDAIRKIRKAQRRVGPDSPAYAGLKQAEEMLDDDLEVWGRNSYEANKMLREARQIDSDYKKDLVPFFNKDSLIGKATANDVMDEQTLKNTFLKGDTGMAVQDITSRVPGTKEDFRKLLGKELGKARGDLSVRQVLEGGTTNEVLMSPAEREYAKKLSRELKRINKEGGANLPSGWARMVERYGGGEVIQRMLGNLRPFGAEEQELLTPKLSKEIINRLRQLGTAEATDGN